jgi:hypothetical protein
LEALKTAHGNLLAAIEELGRLMEAPLPVPDLLINIRWNLSKASLDRRLLWGRIHLELAGRVDAESEDALRSLQDIDMRLLRASAAHVSEWTPVAVKQDWDGYRQASAIMRRRMLQGIEAEKRLLYPILESLTGQA